MLQQTTNKGLSSLGFPVAQDIDGSSLFIENGLSSLGFSNTSSD
jgi:hypothetical protein